MSEQPPGPHVVDFRQFRAANVARYEQSFHRLDAWTPLEWAGAMLSEAGAVANVAKKLRQQKTSEYARHWDVQQLEAQLADELADVMVYVDLLAARCGIDLDQALVAKFNRASDKLGSPIKLSLDPARDDER
jgi:NTP pyrophosphatase (non-canonical NTP hydrolase)